MSELHKLNLYWGNTWIVLGPGTAQKQIKQALAPVLGEYSPRTRES